MVFDTPDGAPDDSVAWGSDVAAQMLRRLGYRYVSLNPGASYRGLHDSLVNHLGNHDPAILLCLHEDHAVGIAHGYAKATGVPMACVLHSNVGLMHGMMGLFNAWCDRVPMFVLGATGPVDAAKRRPWVDWTHTAADQGGMVRDIVKFDNQPASPTALVEAMCRADLITRSLPMAPVYVCLDAGLQEAPLDQVPHWPVLERFQPPSPPHPDPLAIERALALLASASRPLILFGRGGRTIAEWNARVALAERLGACVMTDLRTSAVFPTDHPAHVTAPMANAGAANRALLAEADLILSLEWCDLGGTVFPPTGTAQPTAAIIAVSLDQMLHNGAHMNHQQLSPVDLFIAASADAVVAALVSLLPDQTRAPWSASRVTPAPIETARITVPLIATCLRDAVADPDRIAFAAVCRGWPCHIWPFHDPLGYHGKDGGGGIGSMPSIAVGVALALHDQGRQTVAVLGDGDFIMGGTALWTAVRHRIPLLVLVNNNRSYFNDELHQEAIARKRGRNPANRAIGQAISDPDVDIAGFATMQGALGIGPITRADQVQDAIVRGLAALAEGLVCVIDFHVNPGAERSVQAIGQRQD